MEPRPLADRISGIDDAIMAHSAASAAPPTAAALTGLRFACADFIRRHGDLLDRFGEGQEPWQLIADGVISFWPDDAVICDGLPRGGDLAAVSSAVLAQLGPERPAVLDAAAALHPAAVQACRDSDNLAISVARELLEGLIAADLADRFNAPE